MSMTRLKTKPSTLVALMAPLLLLGACGKAQEAVTEKIIEKVIQSQMEEDGIHAEVDLSDGRTRITTTDAQGQTSVIDVIGAKVEPSEVGLPFYPGAQQVEEENLLMQTPARRMLMVALDSADSVEKIAAYYREALRDRSAGKTLIDNTSDRGGIMLVAGANNDHSLAVNITSHYNKQRITLTKSTPVAKK